MEIPLHGVHFHHGIGNGGAGGEDYAPVAGQVIQVAALHEHIRGLLGFGLGDTRHVPHLGKGGQVLETVGLIHKQPVYSQFLKGDHPVLALRMVQPLQLGLQLLLRPLHLLDGEGLRVFCLGFGYAPDHLVDLFRKVRLLPFLAYRQLFKLAVADDHRVVFPGGDAAENPLAVLPLKIPPGGYQDVGCGVKL